MYPRSIAKETVRHSVFLPPVSVGTSTTQITTQIFPENLLNKGILIYAPGTADDTPNTLSVFIGPASVTADQAATGGFPLAPGQALTLPLEDVTGLYAIAADANQKLNCILV